MRYTQKAVTFIRAINTSAFWQRGVRHLERKVNTIPLDHSPSLFGSNRSYYALSQLFKPLKPNLYYSREFYIAKQIIEDLEKEIEPKHCLADKDKLIVALGTKLGTESRYNHSLYCRATDRVQEQFRKRIKDSYLYEIDISNSTSRQDGDSRLLYLPTQFHDAKTLPIRVCGIITRVSEELSPRNSNDIVLRRHR